VVLHPDIRTELGRDRVVTIARKAEANAETPIVVTPRRIPGLGAAARRWPRVRHHGGTAVQLRQRETT
jgi:hypothetical protein